MYAVWLYIIKHTDVKYNFTVFFNYVKENHMVEYPKLNEIWHLYFETIKTQMIYATSHIL